MLAIETDRRAEDNNRLLKELGDSARGVDVGMPPPVKIVAGNKCDLKDARVIPARDGLEYARKHGCGFMETSARDMVNIEETFACKFLLGCAFWEGLWWLLTTAVLVRRVVEARRLHYQRDPTKDPAETSTAQTPALTDGEGGTKKPKDGRHRRIRFLGVGKENEKSAEESTKRKSWWRRLCCR